MGALNHTPLEQRLAAHLTVLYPDRDIHELTQSCLEVMHISVAAPSPEPHRNVWDQSDVMLITYADTLRKEGEAPLKTLNDFVKNRLAESISVVHLLPFFPFSSDDGFSVMDYTTVNPSCGDWF